MNTTSLSRLLARSGLILLLIYGVAVLSSVLPPKLLQPDWILNFVTTLGNFVSVALVGVVIVHLAGYVSPAQQVKLQVRVGRVSAVLAFLFLFTLPMLGYAVWRNLRDLTVFNREQTALVQAKAIALLQAIKKADTFNELQASMAALQGPAIPDQARAIGLPQLKGQLIVAVNNAKASLPARLNTPTSPSYIQIYKQIVRTSLVSLLSAIAFVFLAWNPVTDKNIFLLYFQSIGLFGVTPKSVHASVSKFLAEYKEKQGEKSQVSLSRKSALRHQHQIRKAEAQQARELKRRQLSELKQAEKRRQERERMEELERKMQRKQELEQERQRRGE